MLRDMGNGTALLLQALFLTVFLSVLFFVVRAAVEGGIRRALDRSLLQPSSWDVVEALKQQQSAEGK